MAGATSLRKLAAALGQGDSVVRRWARNPDWKFAPPYDVAAVRAWKRRNLVGEDHAAGESSKSVSGLADQLSRARVAKTVEQARKLRLERELLEGELLRRDEVERDRIQRVLAVRTALEQLARDVPADVAGLAAAVRRKIELRLRRAVEDICAAFAGDARPARGAPPAKKPGRRPPKRAQARKRKVGKGRAVKKGKAAKVKT